MLEELNCAKHLLDSFEADIRVAPSINQRQGTYEPITDYVGTKPQAPTPQL